MRCALVYLSPWQRQRQPHQDVTRVSLSDCTLFPLTWCEEYLSKALHTPSASLGVFWAVFPLTQEDRPNEAIAAPLQHFALPSYYCQVLSAQAKIGLIKGSFFLFLCLSLSLLNRTLLALGCRVVHVNPNAESSLKKIKLPKKYVVKADVYCLNCPD